MDSQNHACAICTGLDTKSLKDWKKVGSGSAAFAGTGGGPVVGCVGCTEMDSGISILRLPQPAPTATIGVTAGWLRTVGSACRGGGLLSGTAGCPPNAAIEAVISDTS